MAIALGYAAESGRREMEADPQSAALMKKMGLDPYSWMEAMIHPDDLQVIRNNLPTLNKAFAKKSEEKKESNAAPEKTKEKKEKETSSSKEEAADAAASFLKSMLRKKR